MVEMFVKISKDSGAFTVRGVWQDLPRNRQRIKTTMASEIKPNSAKAEPAGQIEQAITRRKR
jgi:hypothetical protein